MASQSAESERARLYKFTKILTLKVAQIVVQSREGKQITHGCQNTKTFDKLDNSNSPLSTSPVNLQWFNLSIPDEPEVNHDTKRILNGEIVTALTNILCIEISLKTIDGDEMVLELWTVKLGPCCEAPLTSVSTIYYRMSVMLKSTLSISRITPAYKMSRSQNKETYKIYHKIYGGQPNVDLLGDNHKEIKVSELHTPIGTILIGVLYRTKMTMLPGDRKPADVNSNGSIMLKSDHFPTENQNTRRDEKRSIDLNKPLTAGAFVDHEKMRELHAMLNQQLPPEPPLGWLLAEQERDTKMKLLADAQMYQRPAEGEPQGSTSRAIEVPRARGGERYNSLMEFPFADGSPITELANFYQECVQLRSATDEWADSLADRSGDADSLSQQLRMFEEAVPEFDNMVASMFSNSDGEN